MEINMKNVTKVGLSALAGALAFTSVQAGEMSLTGSMVASYTKKGGYNTTGNPFGMDKELSVTASGELDNGVGVAYKQTITDAMAYNDSELVFTGVPFMGDASVALTSAGSPISAIDDVTPVAFEEANALVGSIDDVNGMDGNYGIRYTLADVAGSGFKVDAMWTPKHGEGDANAEQAGSGNVNHDGEEGYEVVVSGAVPGVDGLSIGAGYANLGNTTITTDNNRDVNEGTAYIKYAVGGLSIGAQKGVVDTGGASNTTYTNTYMGVSYAISDNLSVSYNEIEGNKNADATDLDQDFDSISLSYTAGGMTIGVADAEVDNASYTSGRTQSATVVQMTIAF